MELIESKASRIVVMRDVSEESGREDRGENEKERQIKKHPSRAFPVRKSSKTDCSNGTEHRKGIKDESKFLVREEGIES